MEKKKKSTKLILKGIAAFLIYFIISEFSVIPFYILGINVDTLSNTFKYLYTVGVEVFIILLIFLLFKDYIINCIKDFKNNNRMYFKEYFKYWLIVLVLMYACNIAIYLFIGKTTANNQEAINELFKTAPIFTFILGVFLAPIIEELAFRLSFRAIFKNKYLFIFFSGLIFGLFHVIGVYETWTDLLYVIPYSVPGWVFAYTLDKSNNICVPMSLHFLHNGILMSLQVVTLLFSFII